MGALQTEVGSAAVAAELVESLHERYAKAIRRYCLRRLHSPEEADDATQVVYLTAYRCLAEGIEPRAEGAWLFKIAENVVLQRRRALARRARVEYAVDVDRIANAVAAPPPEAAPELDGVREALATMPESQRQAIVLREWYGLSYREVANELGVSSAAVEALIFRARRGLVRRLEVRNRLTQNGKRFGLCLPGAPLKYLFGGGGLGAKVVVGAASIAVVAATTHPNAPDIVLTAAKTGRVTTPATTRVVTHQARHRPGGPTHQLRTLAPTPAEPRSSATAASSGAPAAPPVPDAGGRKALVAPAPSAPVVSDSGAPPVGGDTGPQSGAGTTSPSPDTGLTAPAGTAAPAPPATTLSSDSPAPTPSSGPSAIPPSSGPPAATPSGKTPPAVGRTPGANPPGHANQASGTSDPPGNGNGQGNGNRQGNRAGQGNGDGQGDGNAHAYGQSNGDGQSNGSKDYAYGHGAPAGGAQPASAWGRQSQASDGNDGSSD